MAKPPSLKKADDARFIIDKKSGLYVPMTFSGGAKAAHPFADPNSTTITDGNDIVQPSSSGIKLKHEDSTGIAFWPAYGTGYDDLLMRAMVGGYMANGSRTPVTVPMLSTIVAKRQAMVGTWQVIATGRDYPTRKALEIISMANDGLGSASFSRDYIGALDVDNRGAFYSYVPFSEFPLDEWDAYGFNFVRLGGKDSGYGYLEMTDADFRSNRGLWSIDGLRCFPTGVAEWPYWIFVPHAPDSKRKGSGEWVLINRRFGGHQRQHAGPKSSTMSGFGQSGTWRFSPYIVKSMAIDRMDWEAMISQPPRGIAHASGLDFPEQFETTVTQFAKEKTDADILLYPGVIFMGTVSDTAKVSMVPWSEPPNGYTPEQWQNEVISNLAACFHMNETHLRLRLGEGALTQSGVAEALEAETVLAWMREQIAGVYNDATPRTVLMTVNWLSDRQRRFQVETFGKFATAIRDAQREFDQPILSTPEIRALMEGMFGIEIPEVASDTEVRHEKGNVKQQDGGESSDSNSNGGDGSNDEITQNGAVFDIEYAISCQLYPGDRCVLARTGTPVTAVFHDGERVGYCFDWDMYTGAEPRIGVRGDLLLTTEGENA